MLTAVTCHLKGRVIVGEAMFCQRGVCEQIVQDEGDYLVAVNENQPGLLRDIEHEFAARDAASRSSARGQ